MGVKIACIYARSSPINTCVRTGTPQKRQQSKCTFLVYMEPQEYLVIVLEDLGVDP